MAQTILIRRSPSSGGNANPGSDLTEAELGYSFNSRKLFIGDESSGYETIGGEAYTELFPAAAGTLEASKLVQVDSSKKINEWLVDNITLDGNTISTTSGDLIIDPTTGSVDLATGGAIEFKILDGSATSLTISEGSNNYITLDTTNSAEKITLAKDVYADQALYIDGDNSTSSGGVKITNGVIDLKNGGSDSKILFYCGSTNAHAQTLQSAPHSSSASNTLTLPATGTILATQDGAETLTNKTLTSAIVQTNIRVKDTGGDHYWDITPGGDLSADRTATLPVLTGNDTFVFQAHTQTLTNKTLTSPVINTGDINTPDIDGGTIDGAAINGSTIGATSASTAVFTDLTANGAIDIDGTGTSNMDNVIIGATTPAAGTFTVATVDNLKLDGNTLSSTDTDGNIVLDPNGAGTIDASSARITSVADPTGAQDAATKAYVDAVKTGLDVKNSVRVATTANLSGTYSNGSSGVGASLTNSGTNAAIQIDGVTLSANDRVLVKDQSTGAENGIYYVSTVGDGSTAWVLVRSTDADTSTELSGGTFTFVEEGSTQADNGYVFTHNGDPTIGTTALTVSQFSGAGQIDAGDGLSKSGNQLNVNDDNITLEINSDNVRIKGISQTANGDLIYGANGANGGYARLPIGTYDSSLGVGQILQVGASNTVTWTNTIDGGTF